MWFLILTPSNPLPPPQPSFFPPKDGPWQAQSEDEIATLGDGNAASSSKMKRKRMLNASFFSRHSSVAPSEGSEAWKEDHAADAESLESLTYMQQCGYGCVDAAYAVRDFFVNVACDPKGVLPAREESRFGRFWIFLVTIVVFYNVLVIPFRLGFRRLWRNDVTDPAFHAVDYTGDVILLVDIFLNFRTVFISDGIEVRNPFAIARHYRDTRMWWDILASFPIDLFVWSPWGHVLARFNKLLRVKQVRRGGEGGGEKERKWGAG